MAEQSPPIALRDVRKCYGPLHVLSGLSLTVPAGELYGFLGPNGSGKTTTLRILLGLLRADGGDVRLFGRDAWHDGPTIRARVGYLPGDVRFYNGWNGRDTLGFLAGINGVDCRREARRLADAFELDLQKRVRAYSRGMKQKLGIIAALMHKPDLLILDEPTIGLDPVMQGVLYDELRRVRADGRTVLFSSHGLAEVESLCDHVAILRDGHLVEDERISVLRRRARQQVELEFVDANAAAAAVAIGCPGLEVENQAAAHLSGTWAGDLAALTAWLADQPLRAMTIAPPDLERLFRGYYAEASPRRPSAAVAAGGGA